MIPRPPQGPDWTATTGLVKEPSGRSRSAAFCKTHVLRKSLKLSRRPKATTRCTMTAGCSSDSGRTPERTPGAERSGGTDDPFADAPQLVETGTGRPAPVHSGDRGAGG